MVDDIQTALNDYEQKWQTFTAQLVDQDFWRTCTMTAVGWKVEDLDDFDAKFLTLRDISDQIHVAWVNQRWIATFHIRQERFDQGIRLIKLMQRRPGSEDTIGLDNVDFLVPEGSDIKAIVAADEPVEWTEESNGDHCRWISVWFAGTEAKLRTDTVLQVGIAEMQEADRAVRERA